MSRLVLRFLGVFHASLDGHPLTDLHSARIQALLAYLVLNAEQPQRREKLAALLWPDEAERVAKQNLRQTLFQLRQLLGEAHDDPSEALPEHTQFLLANRATVQFNPASAYSLDVAQFLQHLQRGELALALQSYQGDLLNDLTSTSPLFEEWLLLTREHLHQQALTAAAKLTQTTLDGLDYVQAQQYARRQLALEPWREEAHRQLILALAAAGERSAALAQYERCRDLLQAELGVEPGRETMALVAQIRQEDFRFTISDLRNEDAQPIRSRGKTLGEAKTFTTDQSLVNRKSQIVNQTDWGEAPDAGFFYGREEELAEVQRWISNDHCRVVALLGMGGIGKTALAARLARQVADQFDFVVWRSLINAPPLSELLQGWLQFFSGQQLTAIPSSLDVQLGLLFGYLRDQHSLLVLDNVESILADGASGQYRAGCETYAQFFKRMGESNHQSCLLLTSRELPLEAARLERVSPLVRSLPMPGLAAEAGQAVLRTQGISGQIPQANQIVQRYSGNPLALLLVAETIQELYGGDLAAFLREEAPVFDDIRAVLEQQFVRLAPLEQSILLWLAIEREPLTVQGLSENFAQPVARRALLEALNALRRRALIEPWQPVARLSAALQHGDVSTPARQDVSTPARQNESAMTGFALQNVVTEYLTDYIVATISQEIEQRRPNLLKSHALLKAQAKEYVRQSQARLILQPIAAHLLATLGASALTATCKTLLDDLRRAAGALTGYAGGNLLNLLIHMGVNLQALDFSHLAIWQADLQGASLPGLNFAASDLRGCTFSDAFGALSAVNFSPNGEIIAAGDENGQIRLWRSADGQSYGLLEGHSNFVFSVLFSPDGRTLFSAGDDQTIRLWDVEAIVREGASRRQLLQTLHGHSRGVWRVSLSADGRYLASVSGDRTVGLWSVQPLPVGVQLLRMIQGHNQGVRSVAFHPNGRLLATGSHDCTIRLWRAPEGELVAILHGHTKAVWALAFSPDGQTLASGSYDHTIGLWELVDLVEHAVEGAEPQRIALAQRGSVLTGHGDTVTCLAFRPDGKLLASGSNDKTIRLWDVEQGTIYQTLTNHRDEVSGVAFDPTGAILVSSSRDQTVRLWNVEQGRTVRTLQGHLQGVTAIAFSPCPAQGNLLATACQDHVVRLWNWQTNELLATLRGHDKEVHSVSISPDGATAASGSSDHTIHLWTLPDGNLCTVLRGHQGWVRSVRFSPDGRQLISSSSDATARVWDAATGELQMTLEHPDSIWSIAVSPDGQNLASAGTGRVVRLWDLQRGFNFMSLHGHTNWVTTLAYHPTGAILASGSGDQTVRLWDATTGALLHTLHGHTAWVYRIAFSADGALLASAGADKTVCLWELGREGVTLRHTLSGHHGEVHALAFGPDDQTLASGSTDETVRLWDLASGESRAVLRAPRPYEGMQISGVSGLTAAQKAALKTLGAVEDGN